MRPRVGTPEHDAASGEGTDYRAVRELTDYGVTSVVEYIVSPCASRATTVPE